MDWLSTANGNRHEASAHGLFVSARQTRMRRAQGRPLASRQIRAHPVRAAPFRADRGSQRAFTLIELLIVCACLAITLQITAAPFADAIADARSASAMRHLSSLLNYARQEAVLRGTPVTVCALTPTGRCSRDWLDDHRIAVFVDGDSNRRLGSQERILRELRWPLENGELSWRASLARSYIEFENNGATWQNGTLYYCPASRDARQARALVLSQSGRSYLPGDSNEDGIREDRNGRNLRC
jgi:type IV fimbrial biogenesis protein FimT